MQYTITPNNLHVKSSFEIRKKDFERELLAIRAKHPDSLVWSRSIREKDFVREDLARVRATTMEGSFGTQKEHYAMRRIKARMRMTEILYIFFGLHTANAVLLADRLEKQAQAKAA